MINSDNLFKYFIPIFTYLTTSKCEIQSSCQLYYFHVIFLLFLFEYLLIIFQFVYQSRQADQTIVVQSQNQIMDNLKICDTRFQDRNDQSFLQFLQRKSRQGFSKNSDSIQTTISVEKPNIARPAFTFRIKSYQINDHVEYIVQMRQTFKVLGRRISNNITFRTRYSMLERLNQQVGKSSFPPKKFFGNKSPQFLSFRKKQLEQYLNEISLERSQQFLKFVVQIKNLNFNKEMKKQFVLE